MYKEHRRLDSSRWYKRIETWERHDSNIHGYSRDFDTGNTASVYARFFKNVSSRFEVEIRPTSVVFSGPTGGSLSI